MISIHEELEMLAGNNPAGYISLKPFAKLTLNRLNETVRLLKETRIPSGTGVLSAALSSMSWSKQAVAKFSGDIGSPLEIDVLIPEEFFVTVDIFISDFEKPEESGDPKKGPVNQASIISKLIVRVSDTRVRLKARNNVLILEGATFDSSKRIERDQNADSRLMAAGIDLLEAARVEGHLVYGVISQAIALSLAQRTEIPLSEIFPAVDFGTTIKLISIDGGNALGIITDKAILIPDQSSRNCNNGPDLQHSESELNTILPENPQRLQEYDQVAVGSIGGPLADNKDPNRDFGARYQDRDERGEGLCGLYIPLEFAGALVTGAMYAVGVMPSIAVMPAVKINISDKNNTIGYEAEANIGFNNFRVNFDISSGGILLDIDLDISIYAYCDFEIFKGRRLPIGRAFIKQKDPASIQMGFYPSINNDGVISLKSTLKRADMGSYAVFVIGLGDALKFLGVSWWVAFLIDVVLANILSRKLPVELKKAVNEYLGSKEWKLLNGLAVSDDSIRWFPGVLFDTTPDSILISFGNIAG